MLAVTTYPESENNSCRLTHWRNKEVHMADHLDAPGLMSPNMDAEIDITDHYAFQKPGDANKSILIFNVNPLAPTLADSFEHEAIYEIKVDTDADAVAEIAFRITFSPKINGRQTASVRRATGANAAGNNKGGHVIINQAPVSFGREAIVTESGPYKFFAGIRSDPFFFDLLGFLNGFKFTGSDFFIDKNVFAIALDIPSRLLGTNPKVGVWTRTLVPMLMQPDHRTQADQMGRPAINTVFNHGSDKNLFNVTLPAAQRTTTTADGQTFLDLFTSELEALGGYSAGQAKGIAEILLPDVLTFDFSSSAGFLNGRRLQDDVIDIELNLVTNGKVTGDGVGAHTDYLPDFPYLGKPHV